MKETATLETQSVYTQEERAGRRADVSPIEVPERVCINATVGVDFLHSGFYGKLCGIVRDAGLGPGDALMSAQKPDSISGRLYMNKHGEIPRRNRYETHDLYSIIDTMSLALRKGLPVRIDVPWDCEEVGQNVARYVADPHKYIEWERGNSVRSSVDRLKAMKETA